MTIMRAGLFLISLAGFCASVYFLSQDLFVFNYQSINNIIYILLLVILLCNSLVGLFMTLPDLKEMLRKIKTTDEDSLSGKV
ncbi:hypothetical protein [Flavobacterium suaedae]|uniref:hypothetical protein n=1 Tax=Flavobacterium suaedae TaxID=1767027 RepID=UPI00166779B3|nr:hypothetical protein [Flavobacterium suaedae]